MQIVVYKRTDNTLGILNAPGDLQAAADKDVPAGLPYWIIEDTELPADTAKRNKWKLDGTEDPPDGYGA